VSNDSPRSAYELAMERLRQKDRDEGVEERPLTGAQKAAIAEARRVCEAKLAEIEILHRASLRRTPDASAEDELASQYARDRERAIAERDREIEDVRRA